MKIEIKIPAVGESVTEATLGSWNKKSGEQVERNDVLLLVETDKASVEVVAEQAGVLEISTEAGTTVPIGAVVGYVDTSKTAKAEKPAATSEAAPSKAVTAEAPAHKSPEKTLSPDLKNHMSPAVQRVLSTAGVAAEAVMGTGKDGRITKEDAVKAASKASAPAATTSGVSMPSESARSSGVVGSKQGSVKKVAMTNIRKKIAERLVHAQHTAAILTTFNEVDMSRVMEIRSKYKDRFKEKYGVNLGFMGFFSKAVIEALKAWPAVNAEIQGTDILYKNYYNLGVAVGTEKGLIVPVIKDADLLSLAGIEMAIRDFAVKARDGKITVDDLSGGTFTISNGGVYGSLMSTPILNYPQVGILGMHKIEERAVVINGKVEVRPMMYLALSYDHRIIDGKEAVSFLVKVKEGIEEPERLILEV